MFNTLYLATLTFATLSTAAPSLKRRENQPVLKVLTGTVANACSGAKVFLVAFDNK